MDTTLPLERPDPTTPPAAYRWLQEHEPVARVVGADGTPAWLVTSYDLVAAGLTDPRLGLTPPGVPVDERASLFRDGPAHTRLRRLVARAFTPRRVAALAPRIEALADEHVAALVAAAQDGPADLVDLVGAPLAVGSLGLLLGVALEDHPHFRALVDDALRADPMAAAGDPACSPRPSGRGARSRRSPPGSSRPPASARVTTCSPRSPRSPTPTTGASATAS
ncbi:hypothetical protein PHK61_09215 [Actinomycetospora lutea]|uniref:hypothetical protein n=1 Tax=Actinomycetospora lutea TaxID=663604 RepID=UPI0023650FE4|nr:hypothetical protein [Actinomycetospora lutea]MDD7938593.1 hypothetical protein [Actinomycetospora lutea]